MEEWTAFVGSLALIITVICLVLGTTAHAAGLVAAWGNNDFGQTTSTVPVGTGSGDNGWRFV